MACIAEEITRRARKRNGERERGKMTGMSPPHDDNALPRDGGRRTEGGGACAVTKPGNRIASAPDRRPQSGRDGRDRERETDIFVVISCDERRRENSGSAPEQFSTRSSGERRSRSSRQIGQGRQAAAGRSMTRW